jgi:ADP-heptose:LPS heptosyltransferase
MKEMPSSTSFNRVLIFRPDNIGDMILFSGALRHIRALFPTSHITLAVQPHIVNLVELCPFVDNVISIGRLKLPLKRLFSFFHKLAGASPYNHTAEYELVIYPVKSPQLPHLKILHGISANDIVGISGCALNKPERGYPAQLSPERLYSRFIDVSHENPWIHEFHTTLKFLNYLGCGIEDIEEIKPELWLFDSDRSLIADIYADKPVVGIFPGASSPLRIWNVINYSVLSKLFDRECLFVVFGSVKDRKIAKDVERQIHMGSPNTKVINLAGKTTLRQLYGNISNCSILISMESCGLHMGLTSGVPTVGIVGGGHFGRFVPWGNPRNTIFLTKNIECFHCNWRCNREKVECIQGISPYEVALAAKKLLSGVS